VAHALTGTQLYQECLDKSKGFQDLACLSYVRGFVDGMFMGGAVAAQFAGQYCPPKDGIDAIQARLIIEKYLRDHPENLHIEVGLLAGTALMAAFPCPPKSN
jgi:Rap1a immunity proteins